MKALVWNGPGRGASLQDIPVPKAGLGQVVIEVESSGLCHSDLDIVKGTMPLKHWPLVLGHQTAGIVAEVGEGVPSYNVGDRVVATANQPCLRCRHCLTGHPNLCRDSVRLGLSTNGSDAEFVLASESGLIRLPEGIPFEQAAISVDAVSAMYHALIRQAQVRLRDRVVLLGIGGMGIQGIEIAHACGASVLVTSRNDKRLDFARKLGAEVLVNTIRQDLVKEVMAFTSGQGADIIVNSIGLSTSMKQAIEVLRPGGKIIVIGLMEPEFTLPHTSMVMLEAQVIGSLASTKQDVTEVLDLIATGRLHPAVTDTYALEDFQAGFDAMERGEIMGRAALIP